jgi:hypothetical protein
VSAGEVSAPAAREAFLVDGERFPEAKTAISFSPKGIPLPLKSIWTTPTGCVGSQRVIKDSG